MIATQPTRYTRRESTQFYDQLAARVRAEPNEVHKVDLDGRTTSNVMAMLRRRGLEVTVSQHRGDHPYGYISVVPFEGTDVGQHVPQYIATQEG